MKTSFLAGLCVLAAAGVYHAEAASTAQAGGAQPRKPPKAIPWSGYNKGVKWEASIEAALQRAAKETKPVLLYQLVGDLKTEGC